VIKKKSKGNCTLAPENTAKLKETKMHRPGSSNSLNKPANRSIKIYINTSQLCVYSVAFEVLTAVVMNSTIFWDKMQCTLLKVSRRFGEHISIFKVEYAKYDTSVKAGDKRV
jgi:hypothetical protein